MPITKDQILGALPTLKHDDLTAIRAVLNGLLDQGGTQASKVAANAQAGLFTALQQVLGKPYYTPESLKPFNKHAPTFIKFTELYFGTVKTKVDLLALHVGLLRLLADDLGNQKIPVTYTTMSNHLPRIQDVFERAFPGYLASGLQGLFLVRA